MARGWYAVRTLSGQEEKIKKKILRRLENNPLADRIYRIEIPVEEYEEKRGKERRKVKRKVFPGYLLIEMDYSDDLWAFLRTIPGIIPGGRYSRPIPLSDEEVQRLLKALGELKEIRQKAAVNLEVGDKIRVIEGPFSDFVGVVAAVYPDKGKVQVMVSIFGRAAPVELSFSQVEKV